MKIIWSGVWRTGPTFYLCLQLSKSSPSSSSFKYNRLKWMHLKQMFYVKLTIKFELFFFTDLSVCIWIIFCPPSQYAGLSTWSCQENETFSALLALCEGNPPSSVYFGDAGLSCFLWCSPEQTFEQTVEMPVIWEAIALIVMSPQWGNCMYSDVCYSIKQFIFSHCTCKNPVNLTFIKILAVYDWSC